METNNKDVAISNFDVLYISQEDDTVIATSSDKVSAQRLQLALSTYDPKNDKYAVYLSTEAAPTFLSIAEIESLLTNTQSDLNKILKIANYNHRLINENDIIGKTVESINTNINTEMRLTYPSAQEISGRNKKKQLDEFKSFIKDLNDSICPKALIRNAITSTYVEGTWIAYLRHDDVANYKIDVYPLGVCEISDYMVNGEPVVLFNITELRKKLQKTYKKTKKQKALFFNNMEEEVKANYPIEVYEAFKNKENYAKLNPKYTGVVRINNFNRKYGLSPLTRAYKKLTMLETFMNTDRINSKARGKKIIHQVMRKEIMGNNAERDYYSEMAYAHQNFMASWKQSTVVVTSPPSVEAIKYVEPEIEMTPRETYNSYRSDVLSTLGIQFLMDSGSQSVSTASISVTQLMRSINAISEELERVMKKWYRQIIIDNNFPLEYVPEISIIDSERLEANLKQELVSLLFSTMNCSYTTAYDILGLDINDEIAKRKFENEKNFDELFLPHKSQYTSSSKDDSSDKIGRPADSKNKSKQQYDKKRQELLNE